MARSTHNLSGACRLAKAVWAVARDDAFVSVTACTEKATGKPVYFSVTVYAWSHADFVQRLIAALRPTSIEWNYDATQLDLSTKARVTVRVQCEKGMRDRVEHGPKRSERERTT